MDFLTYSSQLGRILFEPVFVLAVCGAVFALAGNIRRRSRFFYPVAGGLLFMFCWRACVQLLSKRYSEIFIYPAVMFAVCFLAVLPLYLFCKFRTFSRTAIFRSYPRLICRVLVLILIAVCIGKLCRYNRFDSSLSDMCEVVRKDIAGEPDVLVVEYCGELQRLSYYLKRPVFAGCGRKHKKSEVRRMMKKGGKVYFLHKVKKGEKISCKEYGIKEKDLELIFSRPVDNRKKYYFNAYRYRSSAEK